MGLIFPRWGLILPRKPPTTLFITQQSLNPFGDMYEHETPPAPPQPHPFSWPDFESGQSEQMSGQNGPHLGKMFESFLEVGKKNLFIGNWSHPEQAIMIQYLVSSYCRQSPMVLRLSLSWYSKTKFLSPSFLAFAHDSSIKNAWTKDTASSFCPFASVESFLGRGWTRLRSAALPSSCEMSDTCSRWRECQHRRHHRCLRRWRSGSHRAGR